MGENCYFFGDALFLFDVFLVLLAHLEGPLAEYGCDDVLVNGFQFQQFLGESVDKLSLLVDYSSCSFRANTHDLEYFCIDLVLDLLGILLGVFGLAVLDPAESVPEAVLSHEGLGDLVCLVEVITGSCRNFAEKDFF